MKDQNMIRTFSLAVAAVLLLAPGLSAADGSFRHHFGISYRMGFNIDASFESTGSRSAPGPATGGGFPRTYDDGFVGEDSSGNAGGETWFWGYNDPGQINGDFLVLSSAGSAPAGTLRGADGDPQHGAELQYRLEMYRERVLSIGLQAAFGWMDIDIRDRRSGWAGGTQVIDAYSLGGIIPPSAPYAGSFAGPGPLITNTPSRLNPETVRRLEADLFTWKLGPYVEFPIVNRLSFGIGGGLAVGYIDSSYRFEQMTVLPGGDSVRHAASGSRSDWKAGGYVGGQFIFGITERLHAYAGAEYQNLGKFKQQVDGQRAVLDLGAGVFTTLGLGWSF